MKKRERYITKTLISLLGFAILLFTGIILHKIHDAEKKIANKVPACLEASIRKYIESKMGNTYYFTQYEHDPTQRKIGEYEDRIFKDADTTFTYRSKVVDPITDAYRGFQTTYLEIGWLSPDSILIIFDSLLQEEGIHASSIIGIISSFYIKKNEWSGDTIALNPNYRTVLANQGIYEDINYYAYIRYSFSTLWGLLPQTLIFLLFICILAIGIVLCWWMRKRKKEMTNSIELRKDGIYRIKDTIYYTNEKRMAREDKEVKLTAQLDGLLLMFLSADKCRVCKTEIKQKFWPVHNDATSNMTSNVCRLNDKLNEVGCVRTIATDRGDNEYYILS